MSQRRRFFIGASDINGDSAVLSGAAFNHAVNVLRLRVGDAITLCAGDGYDLASEITEIDKRSATARIADKTLNRNEAALECALFQGLVKGEKQAFIVQKITELGLSEYIPFSSEFSAVKKEFGRADERLVRIAEEAACQCGRARIPEIRGVTDFNGVLSRLADYGRVFFLYEKETRRSLGDALFGAKRGAGKIALLIGGEGGFSAREAEALTAAGASACSLGGRVLRAETATVAAAAIVMNAYGELGGAGREG